MKNDKKYCRKCRRLLPLTEYYLGRCTCKDCVRAHNRELQERNREHYRELARKWREAHPGYSTERRRRIRQAEEKEKFLQKLIRLRSL